MGNDTRSDGGREPAARQSALEAMFVDPSDDAEEVLASLREARRIVAARRRARRAEG